MQCFNDSRYFVYGGDIAAISEVSDDQKKTIFYADVQTGNGLFGGGSKNGCKPNVSQEPKLAGSHMITSILNNEGVVIGCFKVRRHMSELGLIYKQPVPHALLHNVHLHPGSHNV